MYDVVDILKDYLSFIQISVAFNFVCVIFTDNPMIKLFRNLIHVTNKKASDYLDEYGPKLKQCSDWIHENKFNNDNSNAYLTYSKLIRQHISTFESLGTSWIKVKKDEPICFSHACLLLGCYGLLELFLIPVLNTFEWMQSSLVIFTILVIIALMCLLFIEIRRFRHDEISNNQRLKYLILEVFAILIFIVISFTLPFILLKFNISILILCDNIYVIAVLLPYVSFAICFLWYVLNFLHNKKREKKIVKDIDECEVLYNKFMLQTKCKP